MAKCCRRATRRRLLEHESRPDILRMRDCGPSAPAIPASLHCSRWLECTSFNAVTVVAPWIVGRRATVAHTQDVRPRSCLQQPSPRRPAATLRHRALDRSRRSHWPNAQQVYVTPVSENEVCFVFIGSQRFGSIEQALALFPALKQRLGSASSSGTPMGAVTLSRKLRRVTSGNVALIGDASGSVDASPAKGSRSAFARHKLSPLHSRPATSLSMRTSCEPAASAAIHVPRHAPYGSPPSGSCADIQHLRTQTQPLPHLLKFI